MAKRGPDRTLIVNADDFGASAYINAAVAQAHTAGVLTSASLMVNGSAFDEAVRIARAHPKLGVGIHITLVRGKASLTRSEIPDLVDGEGNFTENPVRAGFRYFFDNGLKNQLRMELEAQIRRFLSTGLKPSHIDGHLHFHMHPTVLEILLELASKYGITTFRLPRESAAANLLLDRSHVMLQLMHAFIFHRLCSHAEKRLRRCGMHYPAHFIGLLSSGRMDERYLLGVIERLDAGATEIGMHPALSPPPEMQPWAPRYTYEGEFRALTSGRVKELIESRGIRLASYHFLSNSMGH